MPLRIPEAPDSLSVWAIIISSGDILADSNGLSNPKTVFIIEQISSYNTSPFYNVGECRNDTMSMRYHCYSITKRAVSNGGVDSKLAREMRGN